MRKFLIPLVLLLFLGQLAEANTSDDVVADIPFSFENGLVIVAAKIKGDIPVNVVLSTGIEYSIIDMALLEKYKLQSFYSSDGPVMGRPTDSTYTFTNVSGVSVGASKSKDLSMRFGSMARVSQAAGREVFAALGADFFEGQIVQFNFKTSVLRFLAKSPPSALKDKKDLGASESVTLRMAEKESNPFKKTFMLPIVGDVLINGKEVKMLLDTGRATSLALSSSAAKKVGFTLPADNGPPRADKAGSLDLGGHKIADVPVMLFAKGTDADQSLSKYGVVAGSSFLQNFLVTFDFKNKIVILEKGNAG
jgi:hypothetical protein